jgi:diguanylate cyclase (GGDEF)-like protein
VVEHYVAMFSDITERKKQEEIITFQAFHDALTGLPNRILFLDRLEQMLVQGTRSGARTAAVMFLDLDRFKQINDTLGHEAGDQCLKEVARRLRQCVRASDTVARMGGDEFTILLPEIAEKGDVRMVAQKILDSMKTPLLLAGQEVIITTSIGISLFPRDGRDGETLLKHADAAMYRVKGSGRAGMFFFVPDLMKGVSRPARQ